TLHLRLGEPEDARFDMTLSAGHVAVDRELVRVRVGVHGVAFRAEPRRLGPLLEGDAADCHNGGEPAHEHQCEEEAAAAARRPHAPSELAEAAVARPLPLAWH